MNLYQMIFKRRSIRKFKPEAVSERLQNDILAFAGRVTALCPEISTCLEIKDNTDKSLLIKGLWKVDAPYYLVLYSEETDGYMMNAGYILEPVLLYMAGKGLGACYLGGSHIAGGAPAGMKTVMLVAFGYPRLLLYRDPATARRLPLKELCVFKEEVGEPVKNILKAVRLSPSALNSQPWRFIVYNDRIYAFACKELFPSSSLAAMRDLSMGIMLSHLSIAAEELWMNLKIEVEEQMAKKSYKSGSYVVTAFLAD